jgi:diguanylate cyclase (GGDEF)-like protein/PAS domain S-box-containing protein
MPNVAELPVPSEAFLFRALMETTSDSIYFKDRQCRLLRVSRKMAQDLGFSDPVDLVGKTDIDLFGQAFGRMTRLDDLRIMATNRPLVGEIESRHLAHGRINWTLTTKLPLHDQDGHVVGLVGITREINEIRQAELALRHLVTRDGFTDVPNSLQMVDRMGLLLMDPKRTSTPFAVLFINIDSFKDANDAHGHEFGDLLLHAFADRLAKSVSQSDTIARVGGDEFVIILESTPPALADSIALKILHDLAEPFTLAGGRRVKITASIGVASYPENGEDATTLLKAADDAMHLAKNQGGNRHLTCPSGLPGSEDGLDS